jgi:uncharacterized protein (TIGR03083 family)
VLVAARARSRPLLHPGWDAGAGDPLTARAAFGRTAAELGALLDTLTPEEWIRPTGIRGGITVADMVLHLIGVERYTLGQLGRGPSHDAPLRDDHYPVSQVAAADVAGADGPTLARTWWHDVMGLIAAAGELGPDQPLTFHDLPGSLRGLLVIRTFELWTHNDDIRRALGRTLSLLDDDRLTLMSTQLMGSLPHGLALTGTTRPGRTARFNLSGPGAGSFDVALAPGEVPGPPDVTIWTSTLDLCRLAANRIAVDALDAVVDGDRSLLEPVLVGATAFAMD